MEMQIKFVCLLNVIAATVVLQPVDRILVAVSVHQQPLPSLEQSPVVVHLQLLLVDEGGDDDLLDQGNTRAFEVKWSHHLSKALSVVSCSLVDAPHMGADRDFYLRLHIHSNTTCHTVNMYILTPHVIQ